MSEVYGAMLEGDDSREFIEVETVDGLPYETILRPYQTQDGVKRLAVWDLSSPDAINGAYRYKLRIDRLDPAFRKTEDAFFTLKTGQEVMGLGPNGETLFGTIHEVGFSPVDGEYISLLETGQRIPLQDAGWVVSVVH